MLLLGLFEVIYTSYWGNLKELIREFGKENIIGISRWSKFWNGKKCSMLFPSEDLLKRYKAGKISDEEYKKEYMEYLNTLNVDNCYKVFNGCVFVCYEKEGFCHRHLVAEWLKNNGYDCVEYGEEEVVEVEVEKEVQEEVPEEVSENKTYVYIDELLEEYAEKSFNVKKETLLKWLLSMKYGIRRRREKIGMQELF